MRYLALLLICCLPGRFIRAQQIDPDIAALVVLDSLTIVASKGAFDVEAFIDLVQTDRSFYEAFRNLRTTSYDAEHEMAFYRRNGEEKARYRSRTRQEVRGNCRTMRFLEAAHSGNFFRRRERYKYYTARLFDRVFFTEGTVCEDTTGQQVLSPEEAEEDVNGLQKHYEQLKQFIFQPGAEVEVPFIGGRTALFSEKMASYYDYSITSTRFRDRYDCYVFSLATKPEFQDQKSGKTIVKFMETFFEKGTLQVMGRRYHMQYQGLLFSFDIRMEVDLTRIGDRYIPERVSYAGEWNIPTQPKEIGTFETRMERFGGN